MVILENIDIDMDFLENINIDKGILKNIDIDEILYRLEFGIPNRATHCHCSLRRETIVQMSLLRLLYRSGPWRDPKCIQPTALGEEKHVSTLRLLYRSGPWPQASNLSSALYIVQVRYLWIAPSFAEFINQLHWLQRIQLATLEFALNILYDITLACQLILK